MYSIEAFFTNYLIISSVICWFTAQILKAFTGVFKLKKFSINEFLFGTGGMPSSHTAAVCGLSSACAVAYGFNSFQFAMSGVFALIVMRDAMGMRREVGEHAKALNLIFLDFYKSKKEPKYLEIALKELVGHTPLQVFFGAIIGICIPIIMRFIPFFDVLTVV